MQRAFSASSSIQVFVPSLFVVPPPPPPAPPPVPGTVTAESLRPPVDPPLPFLRPWSSVARQDLPIAESSSSPSASIPCTVDLAQLERFMSRHDVEGTLRTAFADRGEAYVNGVLASLASPFAMGGDASDAGVDVPVWTLVREVKPNSSASTVLGGKKLKLRHKILVGLPWTVVSYADAGPDGYVVRRNLVYDDRGNAVAQVDFGHGPTLGLHVHGLVQGSLDHAATHDADHLFLLHTVPWPWLCIPDVRYGPHGILAAGGAAGHDGKKGDAANASDDAEDDALVITLPPCVADGFAWTPVSLPFEDCLGDEAAGRSAD